MARSLARPALTGPLPLGAGRGGELCLFIAGRRIARESPAKRCPRAAPITSDGRRASTSTQSSLTRRRRLRQAAGAQSAVLLRERRRTDVGTNYGRDSQADRWNQMTVVVAVEWSTTNGIGVTGHLRRRPER